LGSRADSQQHPTTRLAQSVHFAAAGYDHRCAEALIELEPKFANDFLVDAVNDYTNGLQKVDLTLQKALDEQLAKDLADWTDKPTLPVPVRLHDNQT
jgi:hypothetical protein